jgi:hypothetical protein
MLRLLEGSSANFMVCPHKNGPPFFTVEVPNRREDMQRLGYEFGEAVRETTENTTLSTKGIVCLWGDYLTSGLQHFIYGLSRAAGPSPWRDIYLDSVSQFDEKTWTRKRKDVCPIDGASPSSSETCYFRLLRIDSWPYFDGKENPEFKQNIPNWIPRDKFSDPGIDFMINPTEPYFWDAGINIFFNEKGNEDMKSFSPGNISFCQEIKQISTMFTNMYERTAEYKPQKVTFFSGPKKGLEHILTYSPSL